LRTEGSSKAGGGRGTFAASSPACPIAPLGGASAGVAVVGAAVAAATALSVCSSTAAGGLLGGGARRRRRPSGLLSVIRATHRRCPRESFSTRVTVSMSCGIVSSQRAEAASSGTPSTGSSLQSLLEPTSVGIAAASTSTATRCIRPILPARAEAPSGKACCRLERTSKEETGNRLMRIFL